VAHAEGSLGSCPDGPRVPRLTESAPGDIREGSAAQGPYRPRSTSHDAVVRAPRPGLRVPGLAGLRSRASGATPLQIGVDSRGSCPLGEKKLSAQQPLDHRYRVPR
jgi:hypothetical protein